MPLISLRLEDQLIARLKAAAEKHGVGYQTFLKVALRHGLRKIEVEGIEFSDEDRRAKRSHTVQARPPKKEEPSAPPPETKKVEVAAPIADTPSTLDEDEIAALFASL